MSFVTYTAVIAVRYPELDSMQDGIVFGDYLVGAPTVDFSQSSGMRPLLICMQPRTLAAWLSGYKASSA